ncbi:hypothetical protein RG959_23470 [Domibacillus sp. 8LH]|uniref:hypothetical protein n=1 Tax=Domibacillus sp. 8LH TaxID=3073900 RepID=UPI00316B46CB
MLCKVCNKEFKRLTASHTKTHGLTYEEYLKQYEVEVYKTRQEQKEIIGFFDEFYITVRHKFLEYIPSRRGLPYTTNTISNFEEKQRAENTKKLRTHYLADDDLKSHLNYKKTIGVFFEEKHTKFIGLDIDIPDEKLLNKLTMLLQSWGFDEKNLLASKSGSKGFHVDIFLDSLVKRDLVDVFYQIVLNMLDADDKEIELRGGTSELGYKLPLGIHFKKGEFCPICDFKGEPIENYMDVIRTRKKASADLIQAVLDREGIYSGIEDEFATEDDEIFKSEADEIIGTVSAVSTYDPATLHEKIESIKRLLENGVHEKGKRNNAIYNVSLFLKHEGYCLADAKQTIKDWISEKWNPSIVDKDILHQASSVPESVFKNNSPILAGTKEVVITENDIREILSVETNNRLQMKALQRVYYALTLHAKAYSDQDGVFYMTYEQMSQAGLGDNRQRVKKQIDKLVEMGKVEIIRRNAPKNYFKRLPNQYKLPAFVPRDIQTVKIFKICELSERCSNCLERAYCHLLPARERSKYLKGKEYKETPKCPYNP